MYNAEVKQRYLDKSSAKKAKEIKIIFNETEERESRLNKDVATWEYQEILDWINSKEISIPQTVRTNIDILSAYCGWYIENIDGNIRSEFLRSIVASADYYSALKKSIVKSPEDLCSRVLTVFSVDSGQAAMAAIMLAWVGYSVPEILSLSNSQVDTKNGKIVYSNGDFALLPPSIREVLHVYKHTKTAIRQKNSKYTVYAKQTKLFIKKMTPIDSKYRDSDYTAASLSTAINELRRAYIKKYPDQSGDWCTCSNVALSGGLWRVHNLAMSGVDVQSADNADLVCKAIGKPKRYFKDMLLLYDAYLKIINE